MFQTSTDVFLIVAAFCLLWLTAFVSAALYYVVMMLKETYGFVEEMKSRLQLIDRFVKTLTEKLDHTSATMQLVVQGFSKLADYIQERKTTKKTKRL